MMINSKAGRQGKGWPRLRHLGILIVLTALGLQVSFAPQLHPRAQEATQSMLAVVGADGNIYAYDSNGKNPIQLTTDAAAQVRTYQWPTWATDGRLAFFAASADPADSYSLRVYVERQVKPGASALVAYTSADEVFTYPYWSPGDCGKPDCRDLALLFTPPNQRDLAVRLIRDDQGTFSDRVIGRAAPFYFSFAPGGERMFWHQSNATLAVFDVKGGEVTELGDPPGQFNAPMWSPVDNRLLYAIPGSGPDKTSLAIARADDLQGKTRTVIADLDGPVSFAWSPDATLIAALAGSELAVTDVASGKKIASVTGTIVAHFWSPQGDRLAYIVFNRAQPQNSARFSTNGFSSNGHSRANLQESTLQWYVLDLKTGVSAPLATFLPGRDMLYYLNFFDQFARSHSLWSPDGRFLTYGQVDTLGKPGVMLVDTRTGAATKVASGSIGIWSWK